MTVKNELSLNTGATIGNQLLPDLFHDIDLNGLSQAIENIGDVSGELEPKEKEFAREIITEWNDSVIGRLETRSQQMRGVIQFFDHRSADQLLNGESLEDFGHELAAQTGTEKELDVILTANRTLADLEYLAPERPIVSPDDTHAQTIQEENKYQAAKAIHQIEKRKLERKRDSAVGTFKRALLGHDDIKTLVKEAKRSYNGTDKLVHMTREKGQLAKLNISISSEKAREALKKLVSFTSNI